MRSFDYVGAYAYSVTVNTAGGTRILTDAAVVRDCLEVLLAACERYYFALLAYCFMPDHAHFVLEGSDGSALVPLMKRFKQIASYRYKRRTGWALWQRSFYDRLLDNDDDVAVAVEYVWNNPVVAGLVEDRSVYPFTGPREAMGPDRPEGLSLRRLGADEAKASSLRLSRVRAS